MPPEGAIRIIDDIEPWLEELWATNGTDLLITAGAPPLVRIDGQIQPVKGEEPLTPARAERIVMAVMGDDLVVKFREELEIDFAFSWRNQARLRCNAFHQRDTCAMALRVIPYEIPGFDELGIPPAVERLVNLPMGLVIVTGPTGRESRPPWPPCSTTSTATGLPHRHHRGPHRVRAREPPLGGEPARGRQRHRVVPPGAALGAAGGPRRPARG